MTELFCLLNPSSGTFIHVHMLLLIMYTKHLLWHLYHFTWLVSSNLLASVLISPWLAWVVPGFRCWCLTKIVVFSVYGNGIFQPYRVVYVGTRSGYVSSTSMSDNVCYVQRSSVLTDGVDVDSLRLLFSMASMLCRCFITCVIYFLLPPLNQLIRESGSGAIYSTLNYT